MCHLQISEKMNNLRFYIEQGTNFVQESWAELSKVHFPSPKETAQATAVVVGLTLVMSLWLWMIDLGATWLVRSIVR
jgi:preprotein translocase subunit SecE